MAPSALNAAVPVSKGGTGATSLTNAAILRGNGGSAISAASGSDISAAIGSTYVQNASYATNATNATNASYSTNAGNLTTSNFTITESGGTLIIKYGATTIVTIYSNGQIVAGT